MFRDDIVEDDTRWIYSIVNRQSHVCVTLISEPMTLKMSAVMWIW